jgi:hypothetical protein
MPALPSVPKVLKIVLPFAIETGVNALNRFFMQYTGTAPTPAQLQTFCNSISANAATNMGSLMSGLKEFLPVTAEDLSSPTGAVAAGNLTNAGSRSGGSIPSSACAIINFQIARRYRGGKPKVFCPFGVTTDVATNGRWVPAFPTAFGNAWAAFNAANVAAGWTGAGTLSQVNVSYYSGFNPVQNPVTLRWRNVPRLRITPVVDEIVGFQPESDIGSQRRRNNV